MFQKLSWAAVALAFAVVTTGSAAAQNYALNPTFGTYNLQSGFLPDPYNIEVVAGGPNNVAGVTNGTCAGYAAEAPDVRLHFVGGSFSEINFSAHSASDTTLIINDPNGNWYCDDDSGEGLDPLVSLTPLSGQYDIWIGTYSPNTAPATLSVSELPYYSSNTPSGPNYTLNPTYGTHTLQSGFLPDPYQVQLVAGGTNNVSSMTGGECAGYAASAPDVRLNFTGGHFDEINFSVDSNADTTLIINDPNGNWHCDDDSGDGLDPLLSFIPVSGQYDIWVGTYGPNTAPATLAISELPYYGAAAPSGPDYSLSPTYGTHTLQSGFLPDPYNVNVVAGGSHDVSSMTNGTCAGYAAAAPDVRVNFTGGSFSEIIFSVQSGSDTTLIVNDPNGNWYCDDDSGEGLNPSLRLTPLSGQYDIWVGTYGTSTASATLGISELYSY